MSSPPYPFDFLTQFPSPLPHDIATALALQPKWEVCDEHRRLNRVLYIQWVVGEARNNQIRLAIRTAALVCCLGSDVFLPAEAVIRILEYVVGTRYQIVLPAMLVPQLSTHAETPWDYFLLVEEVGIENVAFERALSMLDNELHMLRRCFVYLRRGIDFAERRRVVFEYDIQGFASRRIAGEISQWISQLPFDMLIRE